MPSDSSPRPGRALRVAASVEALSLVALLVNLATVHYPAVATAVGPTHGTAYLVTILLAWTGSYPRPVRTLALIPGVGGLLAARLDFRDRRGVAPNR